MDNKRGSVFKMSMRYEMRKWSDSGREYWSLWEINLKDQQRRLKTSLHPSEDIFLEWHKMSLGAAADYNSIKEISQHEAFLICL